MPKRRCLPIAALLIAFATSSAHAITFLPKSDVTTGASPYAVVVSDFNGDGKPDLASASNSLNTVSVLLGTGGGTFGAKTDFATGTGPQALAVADLNNDGKLDLVAANFGANTLSVLLGDGIGSFGLKVDFATANGPNSVAIGDLNADGFPDLVASCQTSFVVSVLLGTGTGAFGAKTDFATGSTPRAVAIGDMNGDGKPDLVSANSVASTISVLLGTGSGSFGAKTDFNTGAAPFALAIADFNTDAHLDVAVANSASNSVSLFKGTVAGSLATRVDYVVGSSPRSLTAADLSRDGKPDLAVANTGGTSVSVLVGIGDATFGIKTDYATGNSPLSVASGDFNLNGDVDLVSANQVAGTLSIFLQVPTTHVVLTASPNPALIAHAVVLTASLAPITATGVVTFKDGAVVLGTRPLVAGTATLTTSNLTLGDHTLAATYDGDGTVAAGVSEPCSLTVLPLPVPVVTLDSAPNPSLFGRWVALSAVVSASSATGTITFKDGAVVLGTAPLAAGAASMSLQTLSPGARSLTAFYGGDVDHAAATSPVVTHEVTPLDSTTTTLLSSVNPSALSQSTLLTATVAPAGASGSVEFREGIVVLGTGVLAGGTATLSMPSLCGGSHALFAAYLGDSNRYASNSATLTQVVLPAATTVTLASNLNPARLTQGMNFTATITPGVASACSLSGTVVFLVDSVAFGSPVAVSSGAAIMAGPTNLAAGAHNVQAVYSGNTSYEAGTSATLTQEIESPKPAIASVRDIANDQGGFVKVLWNASYLDLAPYNQIDSYWLFRSAPTTLVASAAAGAGRTLRTLADLSDATAGDVLAIELQGSFYYWEFLVSQPAAHVQGYSYVAPTTGDSIGGSNPRTVFMVQARTAGGAQWWFSEPDSGYSVDNLSPVAPLGFTVQRQGDVAILNWLNSLEPDFSNYRLYRGATPAFTPGPATLLATPTRVGYLDLTSGAYYYKLSAVDVHQNASPLVGAQSSGTTDVSGAGVARFALESVTPNPSSGGELLIRFALTSALSARVELMDITGRRIEGREVGAMGAGQHAVTLSSARTLPAGLYWVRLAQGGEQRMARVVVLR